MSYLKPNETILNYEPESPKNNILRHLEYMPPSPCRNRNSDESESSINLCTETNSSPSSNSPSTPLESVNSTTNLEPNRDSNSPINSIINTSSSHFRPISPNIDTTRPRLIIPPEIKIIYTNENILHT